MKKNQLVGLTIAGVAAVGAFLAMQSVVDKKPELKTVSVRIDTEQVLVAQKDIVLGEVVAEHHMEWVDWPKEGIRPGMVTTKDRQAKQELAGSIARSPIIAGEPMTSAKLIKAGQGGVLAAILPSGMRAVSTEIRQKTAVGGLILPNDHVDVILIRRLRDRNGGSEEFVADTLFENIRVLAIGQQIDSQTGDKAADSASSTTTATLELTPRQSELLALANSMGELTLALRSVADMNSGRTTDTANNLNKSEKRGNSISVMRYGVRSRAYGVN
ncbi:MAG: Flp pilus assembly protein CpaB [Pseudomonadota bacterium]